MGRCIAALLVAALAAAGCSRTWSDEDRRSFLADCVGHVRLDDEALRARICDCWLERAEQMGTYEELKGPDPQIGASLAQVGKECASQIGIKAYLPGER
jgi:hypothetical protein